MALIRLNKRETPWTGFQGLAQLRDEMDRLFEFPLGELAGQRFFNEWAPAVDLYENKDNLIVKAELPGMKKENIEVSLHEGALTIAGERVEEKKDASAHRAERFHGKFQRTVTLPTKVQGNNVSASYKDGVLTISLPKAEEAKPKQIEVQVK
ncbi:MAG: Hsp20/alpha crystallin family protein [Verrucomicrobia bacterium]|nr:Hsp20/alpha crystallin family protein [Verrucomicrobiota bacterium]